VGLKAEGQLEHGCPERCKAQVNKAGAKAGNFTDYYVHTSQKKYGKSNCPTTGTPLEQSQTGLPIHEH
jgi:hypothetical protein